MASFSSKLGLLRHTELVHRASGTYTCTVGCGMTFSTQARLTNHVKACQGSEEANKRRARELNVAKKRRYNERVRQVAAEVGRGVKRLRVTDHVPAQKKGRRKQQ